LSGEEPDTIKASNQHFTDLHNGRRAGDAYLPATWYHPNSLELVTNGTKMADNKKLKY